MSERGLWVVVALWAAGLLAGPSLPPAVFATTAALAACFFLRPRRAALWLLLFALAAVEGSNAFPGGAGIGPAPEKSGLRNPGFRPLVWSQGAPGVPARYLESEPTRLAIPGASTAVAALTRAVLLGERDALDPSWQQAFRRSGTSHLLAVSGLHAGVLLTGMLFGLRLLGLPLTAAGLLSLAGLWGYVLGIGGPPSAVRAAAMATAAILLLGLGRRTPPRRVLPVAILGVLIVRPSLVTSAGLLLSGCAVAGILLMQRDRPAGLGRGAALRALVRTGMGAQFGVLPVQAALFGTLNPLALPVNLLAVPLLGVWLPLQALTLIGEAIRPGAGLVTAPAAEAAGRALLWLVRGASVLPGSLVALPRWAALPGFIGLAAWTQGRRGRPVALLGLALVLWSPLLDPGTPRVTFLDVGQGDAAVIETAHRVVVVDGGPAWSGWEAGRGVLIPYLASRGVRRIDLLVVSHPHNDHIGGLEAVLRAFPVGALVKGEWGAAPGARAERLLALCAALDVPVVQMPGGARIRLGAGGSLESLGGPPPSGASLNDGSVVLRLRLGAERILLTGDLEWSGEARLRGWEAYLRSDVLKAAHHGSRNGTSPWLLEQVAPRLVVISAGARNRYGHPDAELLARLAAADVPCWRTDRLGALVLEP